MFDAEPRFGTHDDKAHKVERLARRFEVVHQATHHRRDKLSTIDLFARHERVERCWINKTSLGAQHKFLPSTQGSEQVSNEHIE